MDEEPIETLALDERYISPKQVCELVPGMTESRLRQRRHLGLAPAFVKPTPRTVVYKLSEVTRWLSDSEQTTTAAV